MTINEIKAIFEELEMDGEFAVYGIRTQEEEFESVGEPMTHVSHIWVDGDETDEELDGVCASMIGGIAAHVNGYYYGGHCAIIGGDHYTYGEDDHEIIIRDPVVVRIIK